MCKVFNIDWLSIYGESSLWNGIEDTIRQAIDKEPFSNSFIENGSLSFDFIKMPYGTRQFNELYSVLPKGSDVCCATIQCKPRAGILSPKSVIIKLANYLLYDQTFNIMLDLLLFECSIKPKSISRIDLALDFYEFDNGWQPSELISRYINKEIIHVGKGKSTVFMLEGKRDLTFTGLQLGKKDSDVNVYLYNKTYELLGEKGDGHHDKPYIRQCWKTRGLADEDKDVWRLEVSMKPEALRFEDKKTKTHYDYSKLETLSDAKKLFMVYVKKLFEFRLPDNENISRCTRVSLFNDIPDIERIKVRVKKASFMADKVFIKKLIMSREYAEIANNDELYQQALALASKVIESCDLEYWYDKRAEKWNLPEGLEKYQPLKDWFMKKIHEWDLFSAAHIDKQLN